MKNQLAIRFLFAANFIIGMAQGITMITIPMYFASLDLTNEFTFFYFLVTVVTLFWSPYAGMLVDKYDRKAIFLWVNGLCGLILAVIWAISWNQGGTNAWLTGAAFAMTFWNFNIHYTGFYAFLQEIAPPSFYGKMAAVVEVLGQLGTALAGALAAMIWQGDAVLGIQLPKLELHWILGINALAYFVALGLLALIRYEAVAVREPETGGALERMKVGWDWLRQHPNVLLFGVASLFVFVVVIVGTYTLFPMYVSKQLEIGAEAYAFSEVWYALGAMFAGFAIQAMFRWTTSQIAIIILTVVTAGECFALATSKSEILFYVVGFLLGITNAGIRVLRLSYLFEIIPNQVSGRANSIFGWSNVVVRMSFLLLFALPFFHETNHVIYAFVILGITMLLAAMALWWNMQKGKK